MHVRVSWGAFKTAETSSNAQRFCFNWSRMRTGYCHILKIPIIHPGLRTTGLEISYSYVIKWMAMRSSKCVERQSVMCEGLEMYISVLEDSHIIILKHF